MAELIRFSELDRFLKTNQSIKNGCLIDTNILFAASYELDQFHEVALDVFLTIAKNKIPRFANVNIRSEFINTSRRVVIAEALIDLLHASGHNLPQEVYGKIRSLQTRILRGVSCR